MRANGRTARAGSAVVMIAMVAGFGGCKSLNERYIALEVWKYEKCFGHYPPGFTPPGAAAVAAPPARVCGQGNPCPPANACDSCQGGGMDGGMPLPPGGIGVPSGPGGSPGPAASLPTPAGVTAGRPVVISDEVVLP
ncbi:MAG: hypothetical protein ACKOOF_08570 [Planctomycetaceae bacterium]|jgi:hypothetical protein